MSREVLKSISWRYAGVALVCLGLLIVTLPRLAAQDGSVHSDPLFELGDGVDPAVPGIADILGSEQPGPDWDDLFNADRTLKDEFDEFGNAGGNGVPDFLDTYGPIAVRRDAVFVVDDVSAGSLVDSTAFIAPGMIGAATVDAGDDLGNVYAYGAFNARLESVLYLGAERLTAADGFILFELNRIPFSVAIDGSLVGERSIADLQLRADFVGGILSALELRSWELLDAEAGIFGWQTVESLPISPEQPAEQCNSSGTLCAVCNGVIVSAGSWPSYGADGSPVAALAPDSFLEIGLNLGQILGHHTYQNYYDSRYVGFQVSTESDYAAGTFARAGRSTTGSQPAS